MSSQNNNIDLSSLRIQRNESKTTSTNSTSSKKKLFIYGGSGIAVIVILFFLVGGIFTSTEEVEVGTVSLVSPSQANSILSASGYVVAQRKAAVASKGTGRLEYLAVIEGDKVKEGEVIGRIENSDVEAALAQVKANLTVAKATIIQAEAEFEEAQANFERQKKLFEQKTISQAEYDIANARFKKANAAITSARAAVQAAEANVRSAEVQVENTIIRAPFDGTVLTKNADVGEVISPFGASAGSRGALVTLADMNSLEVEADVSESNIERIQQGQPCEITLDAFPEKRYRGVVHKIVPTADRAKATVLTKIRFEERDARVLPEMRAKVSFLNNETKSEIDSSPKISVPASAITTRNEKKVVFLLKNEIVKEIPVVLGIPLGSGIEVKQGLSVGDKVVLYPSEKLSSGKKVTMKEK